MGFQVKAVVVDGLDVVVVVVGCKLMTIGNDDAVEVGNGVENLESSLPPTEFGDAFDS